MPIFQRFDLFLYVTFREFSVAENFLLRKSAVHGKLVISHENVQCEENGLSFFHQMIHLLNRSLETGLVVKFFNFETDQER